MTHWRDIPRMSAYEALSAGYAYCGFNLKVDSPFAHDLYAALPSERVRGLVVVASAGVQPELFAHPWLAAVLYTVNTYGLLGGLNTPLSVLLTRPDLCDLLGAVAVHGGREAAATLLTSGALHPDVRGR